MRARCASGGARGAAAAGTAAPRRAAVAGAGPGLLRSAGGPARRYRPGAPGRAPPAGGGCRERLCLEPRAVAGGRAGPGRAVAWAARPEPQRGRCPGCPGLAALGAPGGARTAPGGSLEPCPRSRSAERARSGGCPVVALGTAALGKRFNFRQFSLGPAAKQREG